MKEEEFKVGISGLKLGKHAFDWQIDGSFFESFDPEGLESANLQVDLLLHKTETMIEANLSIVGGIILHCDRSLKPFEEPMSIEEQVFFKYGDEPKELSEDVQIIHHNEEELDFAHLIFELVSVSIPMKRLHPDYRGDSEEEWLYTVRDEPSPEQEAAEEEMADPRWAALKKLNFDQGNDDKQ